MKKNKTILIITLLTYIFLNNPIVKAASTCDYELQIKLANTAANVNVNYEITERLYDVTDAVFIDDPTGIEITAESRYVNYPEVHLYVLNITKDIYITITGNGKMNTYYYDDTEEGTLDLNLGYPSEIVPYEILIFSNHNDCLGDELSKLPITTPKINSYAYSVACNDVDEYFCDEYITVDINMTESDLIEKAMESKRKKEEREELAKKKSLWEIIKPYILPIGISLSIIAGVVTIVIFIQRHRSRII